MAIFNSKLLDYQRVYDSYGSIPWDPSPEIVGSPQREADQITDFLQRSFGVCLTAHEIWDPYSFLCTAAKGYCFGYPCSPFESSSWSDQLFRQDLRNSIPVGLVVDRHGVGTITTERKALLEVREDKNRQLMSGFNEWPSVCPASSSCNICALAKHKELFLTMNFFTFIWTFCLFSV